jgi:hypothetical protein
MKRTTAAEREKEELAASILGYFARIPDPRVDRTRHHSLTDILTLSLCAVICGADSFCAIETYGRARADWLRTFMAPRYLEWIELGNAQGSLKSSFDSSR